MSLCPFLKIHERKVTVVIHKLAADRFDSDFENKIPDGVPHACTISHFLHDNTDDNNADDADDADDADNTDDNDNDDDYNDDDAGSSQVHPR
jgi:hypothetical protein